MRIKNKLTLGICILFAMILMLGTLAISSVYELDRNSRNIYDANNNSLNYARSMLVALEKIDSDPAALDVFIENLRLQEKNITETDELQATRILKEHLEEYQKNLDRKSIGKMRADLYRIMELNMISISHKNQMAEAAAEKIGANPLLARTGAYFHDIGKLKRPLYFKENQMGDNPHDRTDPYVSAAIVTAHTRDGLALAQKYHLPPEIQTIIMEHHGDTPVMYFYHKALQMADGKPVDIADFRYDGQRPTTKESAIVMLADTIEAAVRSIPDPTPKAIEQFIERLVRGKLEDGQLSNSPLTLRDIDAICEAFCKVLNGVFHERIEYPTVNVPARPLVKAEKEAEKETKQMQAEKQAEAEKTPEVKPEAKAEKPDVPEKPAAPVEESEENT